MLRRGDVGRVALTDTNRRRSTAAGRLGGSQGPLLPAGADPGGSRTLFDADRQTVLEVAGGSVSATDVGSVFGPVAAGAPENAVDGDPNTGWLFGDFGRAVGQSITVRFDQPQLVPRVTVRVRMADAQRISKVRIEAGGVSADRPVYASGVAMLALPRRTVADSARVTVLGVSGTGFNLVGVQEVQIPGVRLARIARTPRTMEELVAGLYPAGLSALRRTPLDVVLTRVRGTASATDDEEAGLDRDLAVPIARRYRATAVVRVGPRLSERDLDLLAGGVRAGTGQLDLAGLRTADGAGLAGGGRTDRYGVGAGRPGRGAVVDHRRTAPPSRLGQPHADRDRRDAVAGPDHQGPDQPRRRPRHRRRSRPEDHPDLGAAPGRLDRTDHRAGHADGQSGRRCAHRRDRLRRRPDAVLRRSLRPSARAGGDPGRRAGAHASAAADPVRGSGALGRLRPAAGQRRAAPAAPGARLERRRIGIARSASYRRRSRGAVGPGPGGARATVHRPGDRDAPAVLPGHRAGLRPALAGNAGRPRPGAPVPLDGYAAGWRIDAPGDHTVSVRYAGQAERMPPWSGRAWWRSAARCWSLSSGRGAASACRRERPSARRETRSGRSDRDRVVAAPAVVLGAAPASGRGTGPPAGRAAVVARATPGRPRRGPVATPLATPGGCAGPAPVARLGGGGTAGLGAGRDLAGRCGGSAGRMARGTPARTGVLVAGAVGVLAAVPVVWLALRPDTGGQITAGIVLMILAGSAGRVRPPAPGARRTPGRPG